MIEQSEKIVENLAIKVIGVGGGGTNSVHGIMQKEISDVEFIIANTDAEALSKAITTVKLELGFKITEGLGAGGSPEIGKKAAEESIESIRKALNGAKMVFITAGMGGGTGSGASPIIAKIAHDMGALTIAVVTKPLSFEGPKRSNATKLGIKELKKYADVVIVFPNDKLLELGENITMQKAFAFANDTMRQIIQSIIDVFLKSQLGSNVSADIKLAMKASGLAFLGIASASNENRAIVATEKAINSQLNTITIKDVKNVIVHAVANKKITTNEFDSISSLVQNATNPDTKITFGNYIDKDMEDEIKVTIIGFGS